MLKCSFRFLSDLCVCGRICCCVHSRWTVLMALSWKVCSFKCITWDTTLCAGQGLPQEKVPDGYVRISPSLSCNTEFPSIMFLSLLLACPVENAWSVEQMPLFLPDHGAWGFRAGGLVSYVEATVDLVLLDQRFQCLMFWSLLSTD